MSTASSDAPAPPTSPIRSVLPGLLLAMLLAMLDAMIVSTALPAVVGDLGGFEQLSWVVAVYLLTSTVSTPIWGRLGDLLGRKNLFLASIGIFLAGSVLSGIAGTMTELIIYRAVQGIGAGGLIVGVMTIIGILSPPAERGRYQSYIAALSAVATIGGPLLGGALTDGLSWRWAFYLNIPIGAVSLVLVALKLKLPAMKVPHRVDYLGAVLLTVVSSAAVLICVWGGSRYAWASPQILVLAAVGVLAFVGTIAVERGASEPILSLKLFAIRDYTASLVLAFLVGIVLYGSITFLPVYQQSVHGLSATNSGLLLLPVLGGQLVTSIFTGRAMKGPAQYRLFCVLGGVALTAGALLLSMLDTDTDQVLAAVCLVVLGVGIGFLFQNVLVIAQNGVAPKEIGAASGTLAFFRTIGGTFGVSLFGGVFTSRLRDALASKLTPEQLEALTRNGGRLDSDALRTLPESAKSAYVDAVAYGTQGVFTVALVFGVLATLAGFLVRAKAAAPAPTGSST